MSSFFPLFALTKRRKFPKRKREEFFFSPFGPISHNLIQNTIMSICRVCQEVRFAVVNLCAVPNCDSAVCAGCIRGLIQHGHLTNCLCCRTEYPPEVAQELQHAAQPPIPFPSMSPQGVTNVRDAMGALLTSTPGRSVRRRLGSVSRRLLDDDTQSIDQFYITGMLHCPEIVRECNEILSYDFSFRWDTATTERRFLIVNGLMNDRLPVSSANPMQNRTGFTTHRYQGTFTQHDTRIFQCSSRPNHLPPVPYGPLFLNDRSLIPERFQQSFEECKYFYLRDQVVRNYNPWYYGHRPWGAGETSGAADRNGNYLNEAANITGMYTDAIKVAVQWPYISYRTADRGIFLSLAFSWCVQVGVLPRLRVMSRTSSQTRFFDISPVYSSRLRATAGPFNYCEFDCVCMLSIRRDDTPTAAWRTGLFLFFTFVKTNGTWSISNDSCAVSPNRNSPKITMQSPFDLDLLAHDTIDSFCRRFP